MLHYTAVSQVPLGLFSLLRLCVHAIFYLTLADDDNATLVSVAVSLEGPGFEAGRDRLVSTGAAAGMEVVDAAADGSRLLLRAGTGVGSLGFGTLTQFQSTLRGVRFAHGPRRRSARSGSVL
jgi:hypothetical protein